MIILSSSNMNRAIPSFIYLKERIFLFLSSFFLFFLLYRWWLIASLLDSPRYPPARTTYKHAQIHLLRFLYTSGQHGGSRGNVSAGAARI